MPIGCGDRSFTGSDPTLAEWDNCYTQWDSPSHTGGVGQLLHSVGFPFPHWRSGTTATLSGIPIPTRAEITATLSGIPLPTLAEWDHCYTDWDSPSHTGRVGSLLHCVGFPFPHWQWDHCYTQWDSPSHTGRDHCYNLNHGSQYISQRRV